MDSAPVTVPLQTGLKVIDALIPVGRGQRELILGDRRTGKTAIALDTILNQRDQNVVCVYCAIGQRASAVAKVVANLREKGAMDYTVVMVAEGNDPPGLAYIAPYAATSIAENSKPLRGSARALTRTLERSSSMGGESARVSSSRNSRRCPCPRKSPCCWR